MAVVPDMPWRQRTFGFPEAKWNQAKLEARGCLVETARRRSVITYSELRREIASVEIPARGSSFGRAIGLLLGQVNADESDRLGKPMMLSAVVVANDLKPGAGFKALLRRLGWSGDWSYWLFKAWKQYST